MEGLYIEGDLADSISLLGVYIDIIRWEFEDFVRTWNSHKFRKSKDRLRICTPYLLRISVWTRQWCGMSVSECILEPLWLFSPPFHHSEGSQVPSGFFLPRRYLIRAVLSQSRRRAT